MENKEAHIIMNTLENLFEMYNEKNFTNNKAVNEFLLICANDGLRLLKYLDEKEQTEEVEMYLLYTGRVIMRLSSLIHNGREETSEERVKILDIYKPKRGWHYLYLKNM